MTDQWNNGSGVQDPAAPNGSASGSGSSGDRWLRRPRRSTGDRKIAGVAGGLGRAFGIDPVLIRVAFVVLTVFGGFGGLLYVLGWLLLPADGDEVSAAEALLGRGRSSVPPPLAVGLGIAAVIAAFSMFSWGLPFLPLAIGGVIVLAVLRKRRRYDQRARWANYDWSGRSAQDWAAQSQQWANDVRSAARAGRFDRGNGQWQWQGCGSRKGPGSGGSSWGAVPGETAPQPASGTSPFDRPPFWEQPAPQTKVRAEAGRSTVNMSKSAAPSVDPSAPADENDHRNVDFDAPTPRTTPPAWDPLGVAPFAWDLPEPTPLPQPSTPGNRDTGTIARITMGATLLVGGLTAVGVFAWWSLSWAQVAAVALGVLALGLLFSALRGRGYSLVGPGIFLSLVTLALAVTGISGTSGYGATELNPTYAQLQNSYTSNACDFRLDLSGVTIPKGEVKSVEVDLRGGHAEVVVPAGMNVNATCSAGVGHTECLGNSSDGVRKQSTGKAVGETDSGTLNLELKVNAGMAEVISRG